MWNWTKKNIATVVSLATVIGGFLGAYVAYANLPKIVENNAQHIVNIEQTTNTFGNDINQLKVKSSEYGIRLDRTEAMNADLKLELKTYQSEINATLKSISRNVDKLIDMHINNLRKE